MTFSGITTTLSNSAKQINKLAQDVSTDLKNTFGPTVDKLHDGIDVLKAGSDVVSTVVKDVTGEEVTISSIQKGADDFDSKWDSFAKEVNDKFGNTTQSNQANIMETFAKSNFGNDVYNVGSAIKNEMPGVLDGIAKCKQATSKSGTNSKTAEEAAKKIQAGVNNIVKATEKVAGSLNNAITICTGKGLPVLSTLSKIGGSAAVANLNKALNLGVAGATTATAANQLKESLKRKDLRGVTDAMAKGADSINDVLSQVQALCPNFPNAQIPVQITNSIRLLKNGQSIYDAAGNMLTALVADASGHVTPGSILNLASNFNKNWDTFSSTIDALFQVTPGNGQQAVLETVAKTMFGTNVFNAGSVIKRQLPGVLSGINGVQDALKQFGGSYRDPIAAATKIKKGVEKIIQSVEKISKSLGGMVKTYQGGQGNTLLNTLGNISGTKGIKTLDTALRIGGGATAMASNAGALAQAIKNNDLKGAIAAAKQAFSDIKTLTKKGQYKDQSSSDNSASTPTGTAAQSKTANSNSSNDPLSNKKANKNAAAKTDSYVCSGATLRCTKGTSQAKLTVLPSRTVYLTGQPMANISDHLSMVNLSPFGRCQSMGFPATASATAAHHGHLTPMPCMHNTPLPWMGGKNDYIVKGDPALLKSSTCSCLWGGTISIVDDGQKDTGSADMSKLAIEEFTKKQEANKNTKDGSISEKFKKAQEYRKKGLSIIESFKRANQDVNFEKSRNKEGFMSDEDADLKKSNPNYTKNKQFGINCATTTTTFMLRKQGYDLTARGRNANEHTDSIAYGLNLYKAWENPDGTSVSPTMLSNIFNTMVEEKGLKEELDLLKKNKTELIWIREKLKDPELNTTEKANLQTRDKELRDTYYDSRKQFAPIYKEMLMETCKEEGYYTFGLVWEAVDIGGGHYTVLKSKKDKNGNIVISNIEPQTGEPFENIDEMIEYLDYPPDPYDTVLRTDDKIFNKEYNDLFEIK